MRKILSGLVISLATVMVVLLIMEVSLRALHVGSDSTTRPHPWAGWVHVAGRDAEFESEDRSLGPQIRVHFNALGLRDVERTRDKPANVYRVLVLGDSYVEGMQVPQESTFTRRIERSLNGLGGRRVEVWNAGIAGYTTSNELLYFRHEAKAFQPDLVVLCFLSGNDVADQLPATATTLNNRPFFHLENGQLVLDRSHFRRESGLNAWLRNHSRAYQWAKRQVLLMTRRAPKSRRAPPTFPIDLEVYSSRPDSTWSLAWDLTERLLVALRDEVRAAGADFLLVSISNGVQESPEARRDRPNWVGWIDRPEVSMDGPETRLAAFSKQYGIDYLPLLPAFRVEVARTGRPLHIDWVGHWNVAGHTVAASAIGGWIATHLGRAPAAAAATP
jgi:hypothetical protein